MNINVYLYNMNICKSNHALSYCRCACCTLLFIEINSTNILGIIYVQHADVELWKVTINSLCIISKD